MSRSAGNIFKTSESKEANSSISEAGHHLWGIAFTGLVAVFVKGYIPDPVGFVFNGPLSSG
jgi:hypothetical protein